MSVGGTISDKNVIKTAELSIREKVGTATCMASPDLEDGTGNPVVRNKRDLENDTNEIVFDESFTLRQAEGTKMYCFWLASADVAVNANGRGDGNPGNYELGSFSVSWPEGEPPPTPGPTFEFSSNKNVSGADVEPVTELEVAEGTVSGDTYTYYVKPVNLPDDQEYPFTVTVTGDPGIRTLTGTALFAAASDDSVAMVLITEHDTDIDSEELVLTHSAPGFEAAALMVKSLDDDAEISVNVDEVWEDSAAVMVEVTVTAGTEAPTGGRSIDLDWSRATGGATAGSDFVQPGTRAVVIPAGETSHDTTYTLDPTDDAVRDEKNESIEIWGSGSDPAAVYIKPAYIRIWDNDPDITLTATIDDVATTDVSEGAGAVTVTITAEATNAPVLGQVNLLLAVTGGATGGGTDYTIAGVATPVPISIDVGETTASATFTLTVVDDAAAVDAADETIVFDMAAGVAAGGKTYTVSPLTLTIKDNDS